jgi:DNA segregation ATPase FtsK/SpoIIIE-like protein
VVEPEQAVLVLQWLVKEMMRRYGVMRKAGVRDLAGYNAKPGAQRMARIVVIIDEVADLMMTAKNDVEYAVQRLSQMARAAGIHLIMATQRPSVDVITGPIKANFTSRLAVQTASATDSRTILDENGAEALLGKGDMLYLTNGRITRVHGPFVDDAGVAAFVAHIEATGAPSYCDELSAILDAGAASLVGIEGEAERFTRADVPPPVEPQKRYTPTQIKYIAFLARIIPPLTFGGIPMEGSKVRSLAREEGLTNIEALFGAADALCIKRLRREGAPANEPDTWMPSSEHPAHIEGLLAGA